MSKTKRQWGDSYLDAIDKQISEIGLISRPEELRDGWICDDLKNSIFGLVDPQGGTFRIPKRRILYFQSSEGEIIREVLCSSKRLQRMMAMLPSFGCKYDQKNKLWTAQEQESERRRLIRAEDSDEVYAFLYQKGPFTYTETLGREHAYLDELKPSQRTALSHCPCYRVVNFHEYSERDRIGILRAFTTYACFMGSILLISSPENLIPKGYEDKIELIEAALPRIADIKARLHRRMGGAALSEADEEALAREARAFVGFGFSQIDRVMQRLEDETGYCCQVQAVDMQTRQRCEKTELRIIDEVRDEMHGQDQMLTIKDCSNVQGISCPPGYRQWLELNAKYFKDGELAKLNGEDGLQGILMAGVPGTGKSLMAQYTANRLDVPMVKLSMTEIKSSLQGESTKNLKAFLRKVEEMRPCVLWIDEIEKVFQKNDHENKSDTEMRAELLGWLQENKDAIFCYFTANSVNDLPSELLRDGRLSERFFIFMPAAEELAGILRVQLRRRATESEDAGRKRGVKEERILLAKSFQDELNHEKTMNVRLLKLINSIVPKDAPGETGHMKEEELEAKKLDAFRRKPLFFTGANMEKLVMETIKYLNNSITFRERHRKAADQHAYTFEEFEEAFLICAQKANPQGCSDLDGIASCWLQLSKKAYKDVRMVDVPDSSRSEKTPEPVFPYELYNPDYTPAYASGEDDEDNVLFRIGADDWRVRPQRRGSEHHYDHYLYQVITMKIKELIDNGKETV